MPDYLSEGPNFDDDGMELPHLDIDSMDRNGRRHPGYRLIGKDKAVFQRHYSPINRREVALLSDNADYIPTDEDLEDKEAPF